MQLFDFVLFPKTSKILNVEDFEVRRKRATAMAQNAELSSMAIEMRIDPAELRLNELGYKQELRREITMMKIIGMAFSTVTLMGGITPLYGSSLSYYGPAAMIWGWFIVMIPTWFIGLTLAEICSSFPTTGSLYFWTAKLVGQTWSPIACWCCAWLETIALIAGIGTQAYAGSQTLQSIILLKTGTAKNGGYFAPRGVFLALYILQVISWGVLNQLPINIIATINLVSFWWQIIGGSLFIVLLPLVAPTTQSASYVFGYLGTSPEITGITSKPYCFILAFLVSQAAFLGYDAAAHMTEETKGADKNGPIAILSSIGILSVLGWAYILSITFSIQDFKYLYDTSNETMGNYVPAQILYAAFHGRYHSANGAIAMLFIIWISFYFGGLAGITMSSRVVYALSRDGGVPFSKMWQKLDKRQIPSNASWLCSILAIIVGLPILKMDAIFTAIVSVCCIAWVGAYAIPILAYIVMPGKNFKPGPFHLGCASPYIAFGALVWICFAISIFLLPTSYPITWKSFNYAPVALAILIFIIMSWWTFDARHWFKGPVKNVNK